MKNWWNPTDIETCPVCNGDLEIYTAAQFGDWCLDGDAVRCTECNFKSSVSVDEDGEAWVQDPIGG
jgi:C4-type Zn-finger protein